MPATNFTPIQLYRSTTASQVPTSGNLSDGELAINTNDEKLYFKNSGGTVKLLASSAGASGDVVGPASATDNAVVRFDGTTGKLVQNSVVTIADSTGDVAGVGALTMGGNLTLSGGTANGVLYLNGSKVATSGSALTFDGAILGVNGVSVGRGAGAVSSNTAVGASALAANTTGANNTASGYQALYSNTTASYNTAVGYQAGYSTTTGQYSALLGTQAGYSNTVSNSNVMIGYQAGYSTTGNNNVFVGTQSGTSVTTGTKNTIIGAYNGNQGGVDIRALDNNVVISDGDGNPKFMFRPGNGFYLYSTGSLNINLSVPNGSKNTAQNLITSANLFPNQNWGGGAILLIQSAASDSIAAGYVRTEIISVLQRFGTYSVVSLASNVLDGLGMTNWTYSYDGSYFKITQNWGNTATLSTQFNIVNITGAIQG